MITDETLQLAQSAAVDLRQNGALAQAQAVEALVQASQHDALPKLGYLTATEAGELFGVTGQTIKNWVRERKLAGFRLGSRIVISRESVEAYVKRARGSLDLEDLPDDVAAEVVAEGRRS